MKKMLFLVFICFMAMTAIHAVGTPVAEDSVRVDFAGSAKNIEYGFAKNRIVSLSDPVSDSVYGGTTENNRFSMWADYSKSIYTTDTFYFNVKIFTSNKYVIKITDVKPLTSGDATIHFYNRGEGTYISFSGSRGSAPATLVDESSDSTVETDFPRVYSLAFDFQVPFDDVNDSALSSAADAFTGSITIGVEVDG